MKRLFLLGACAAMMAACTKVDNGNQLQLLDGTWTITELAGAKFSDETVAQLQIEVGEMRFAGNAGCNSMNGDMTAGDQANNELSFEVKASTRMMCPEMDNDAIFQDAINKVASFSVDTTGVLPLATLVDKDGNVLLKLQYLRKNGVDEWSIKGTWKVKSVNGEAVDKTETTPEFFFDLENNLFGGNTGCNSMGGSIELSDATMKFTNPYVTEMLCDEHSMDIENKIAGVLTKVAMWSVENAELHLLDEEGNVLVELIRE
ncbi:MAG: META domain-containing protein [Bacteroidales bacterium]|nr:META domain-containing protein [Bacteroidales bacterium]